MKLKKVNYESFFLSKKKDFKVVHFTLVVAFFLLFFLYTFFKDLFHLLVPAYKGEISFAKIIIVFLFFYLFFINAKNSSLLKFILILLTHTSIAMTQLFS